MLCSIVRARFSIFTWVMVRSSFSIMNDIIESRSGRIEIDTYNIIMTIKYRLKLAGVTDSSKFHRKNILSMDIYVIIRNLHVVSRSSTIRWCRSLERTVFLGRSRILDLNWSSWGRGPKLRILWGHIIYKLTKKIKF